MKKSLIKLFVIFFAVNKWAIVDWNVYILDLKEMVFICLVFHENIKKKRFLEFQFLLKKFQFLLN